MAVNAVVENLDGLPDALKSEYKEITTADGKKVYHLDLAAYDGHTVVKGLKDEAGRHRIAARTANEALNAWKVFGERKPEEIQALLDRMPELEAAAAAGNDPAKVQTLVDAKLKTVLAPVERERDKLKADLADRDAKLAEATARDVRRQLHDGVREALKKSTGFQETAADDVLMLAERVFDRQEDGSFTVKDGMGVTPGIDIGTWLVEMQPKRPHWWGPTVGGGAVGGRNAPGALGNGANPFSHDGWNVTAQSQLVMTDRKRADALAAAAGTVVGGRRPAPPRK